MSKRTLCIHGESLQVIRHEAPIDNVETRYTRPDGINRYHGLQVGMTRMRGRAGWWLTTNSVYDQLPDGPVFLGRRLDVALLTFRFITKVDE